MSGARISPLAGKLLDPAQLIRGADNAFTACSPGVPDPSQPAQRVHFGTRVTRLSVPNSFNEPHIVAVAQAICLYRGDME